MKQVIVIKDSHGGAVYLASAPTNLNSLQVVIEGSSTYWREPDYLAVRLARVLNSGVATFPQEGNTSPYLVIDCGEDRTRVYWSEPYDGPVYGPLDPLNGMSWSPLEFIGSGADEVGPVWP